MTVPRAQLGFLLLGDDAFGIVLTYLDASKDFASLCLVDHYSRIIVEPLLYKRVEWTLFTSRQQNDYASQSRSNILHIHHSTIYFLRTLLSRPALGYHTAILGMRADHGRFAFIPPTGFMEAPRKLIELVLAESKQAIEKIGVPFAVEWIDSLQQGSLDALFALIISQSPNLRCLSIDVPYSRGFSFTGKIIGTATIDHTYRLPSYSHLVKVQHEFVRDNNEDWSRGLDIANITPFLSLVNLQRLVIGLDLSEDLNWRDQPPRLKSLRSLELHSCREWHLANILGGTPGLTTFKWVLHYSENDYLPGNYHSTVNLDSIAQALLTVRHTLEDLTIDNFYEFNHGPEPDTSFLFEGDLQRLRLLQGLRTLSVPLPILFAAFELENSCQLFDVVPLSVQTLTVSDALRWHNLDDDGPPWEYNTWRGVSLAQKLDLWFQHERTKLALRSIVLLSIEESHRGRPLPFWNDLAIHSVTRVCNPYFIRVQLADTQCAMW